MATAEELFTRHEKNFREALIRAYSEKAISIEVAISSMAMIYSACIIAEAMTSGPDMEAPLTIPHPTYD